MILLREQIGAAFRRARKAKQLTLRDISERASISISHVSQMERGLKEASSEFIGAYAQALEIPLSRLLQDAVSFTIIAESPVPDTPAGIVARVYN